jgi:hypothetical protein
MVYRSGRVSGGLVVLLALSACESSRSLVATPAATPWPTGSHVRAVLLLARSTPPDVRGNTLLLQASDSAAVSEALPVEVASASTLGLLVGGVPVPVSAVSTVSAASGLKLPAMAAGLPSVSALLPRSDGTQELSFVINQRMVRTFTATLSVIP